MPVEIKEAIGIRQEAEGSEMSPAKAQRAQSSEKKFLPWRALRLGAMNYPKDRDSRERCKLRIGDISRKGAKGAKFGVKELKLRVLGSAAG